MPLKNKILELQKRRELVQQGGGEKAIEKQIAMGKLTARERITSIVDKDSFNGHLFNIIELKVFNV